MPLPCVPTDSGDEPAPRALTLVPSSFPLGCDEDTGRAAPEYDANGHYAIGPKLAQAKWARDLKSAPAPLLRETPDVARGRMQIQQARARRSLEARPPEGFFACGHQADGENVLRGARRDRCRTCFNARRRARYAEPTPPLRLAA